MIDSSNLPQSICWGVIQCITVGFRLLNLYTLCKFVQLSPFLLHILLSRLGTHLSRYHFRMCIVSVFSASLKYFWPVVPHRHFTEVFSHFRLSIDSWNKWIVLVTVWAELVRSVSSSGARELAPNHLPCLKLTFHVAPVSSIARALFSLKG